MPELIPEPSILDYLVPLLISMAAVTFAMAGWIEYRRWRRP
jgi:hypothetical protein